MFHCLNVVLIYDYDYVYIYVMMQNGYAYWFLVDRLYEFVINVTQGVLGFVIIKRHMQKYKFKETLNYFILSLSLSLYVNIHS
jgi:transcription antitermination factor NusG